MNNDAIEAIEQCCALSAAGKIPFPEVIGRLIQAGVERYHTDFSRMETTYYQADGPSHVVPLRLSRPAIADAFSAPAVEASVRQSQRGEIQYPQFISQTTAGGCIGYFVLITGQRVQYFGRRGEIHTEWFPGVQRH